MQKKDETPEMNLKDAKLGQKCKVLNLRGGLGTKKRLLDMGITPGAVLEVERVAPLGDPIDIKIRGYHLSLRKDEAESIEIEVL